MIRTYFDLMALHQLYKVVIGFRCEFEVFHCDGQFFFLVLKILFALFAHILSGKFGFFFWFYHESHSQYELSLE